MNPGPVEEAGKAVGGFMEIMKQQPLSLALVLMNLSLLGLFYIIMDRVSETRRHEFTMLQQEQQHVRDILAKCIVPQPRTDLIVPSPTSSVE
jgi:hypothetical protein